MKVIKKYLPLVIGLGIILLISSCNRKGSGCPAEITSIDIDTIAYAVKSLFA